MLENNQIALSHVRNGVNEAKRLFADQKLRVDRLMAADEDFRHLAEQHAVYHHQLEALEAKSHLTEVEEVEEHRLKKLKLQIKDQMTEIMSRYKTQNVA